jgi:hypothetical protein
MDGAVWLQGDPVQTCMRLLSRMHGLKSHIVATYDDKATACGAVVALHM